MRCKPESKSKMQQRFGKRNAIGAQCSSMSFKQAYKAENRKALMQQRSGNDNASNARTPTEPSFTIISSAMQQPTAGFSKHAADVLQPEQAEQAFVQDRSQQPLTIVLLCAVFAVQYNLDASHTTHTLHAMQLFQKPKRTNATDALAKRR
jgi:hypothetical protein